MLLTVPWIHYFQCIELNISVRSSFSQHSCVAPNRKAQSALSSGASHELPVLTRRRTRHGTTRHATRCSHFAVQCSKAGSHSRPVGVIVGGAQSNPSTHCLQSVTAATSSHLSPRERLYSVLRSAPLCSALARTTCQLLRAPFRSLPNSCVFGAAPAALHGSPLHSFCFDSSLE